VDYASTGEGGQYRYRAEEDGHRPADQHPDACNSVDGAFGYGTRASSFLVPPAPHERVDAVASTDQPQDDEQGSRRQHRAEVAVRECPPTVRAASR
jgi:hypothetical protein